MERFKNKVALVTGGTSGIGKATAALLLRQGASVVVSGRQEELGRQAEGDLGLIANRCTFIRADVGREDDVKALVRQTVEKYGRLDLAFNNAGIEQTPGPWGEQTEQMFDQVMNTNVKGVWLCLREELREMARAGGGAIVNTSSFSGVIAFANIPLYVASKHAVVGLTKAAALEFAPRNIRVNALLPGAVEDTGTFTRSFGSNAEAIAWARSIHPLGRLAQPQEIAAAAGFLLSDESSFMTGHSLLVDGGYTAG